MMGYLFGNGLVMGALLVLAAALSGLLILARRRRRLSSSEMTPRSVRARPGR
jgi:hypothetical protein